MRTGKLGADELKRYVFSHLKHTRSEVKLSAALGEDSAAIETDGFVLLSSDPITAAMPCRELGSLAVDVSCNDIAANGGEPVALMLTVIVPVTSSPADIGEIMSGAGSRASEVGVDIIGGHTEFSDCVTRPIVSATAVGTAKRLIVKSSLKAGDEIYMTKVCGIEGTVILAEKYSHLLSEKEKAEAAELKKLLSVKRESEILRGVESITTMHDVTEGGILGSVAEIALGAGLGARLDECEVPVANTTKKLCTLLGIDPLKLIASGSMLFTGVLPDGAKRKLEDEGITVSKIGRITNGQENTLVRADGAVENFSTEPDKLLSALINNETKKEF